jgi:hypothetical protein
MAKPNFKLFLAFPSAHYNVYFEVSISKTHSSVFENFAEES